MAEYNVNIGNIYVNGQDQRIPIEDLGGGYILYIQKYSWEKTFGLKLDHHCVTKKQLLSIYHDTGMKIKEERMSRLVEVVRNAMIKISQEKVLVDKEIGEILTSDEI